MSVRLVASTLSPHKTKRTAGKVAASRVAARRKVVWSLTRWYWATRPIRNVLSSQLSSWRTAARDVGSRWNAWVSMPLGIEISFSGAKPRRAYSALACSEQKTIREGTDRESDAHAETVNSVERLVKPGMC